MNKKHLQMFKKTKEGQAFIDELMRAVAYDFNVINGKIVDINFKSNPVLDLDEIERKVLKMRKEI